MKNKLNLWLAFVQVSYLSAFSSFFSFQILFLREQGYSSVQCGIVQALTAVAVLVIQPMFGYITDNVFSCKKVAVVGLVCVAGTSVLIPATASIGTTLFFMVVFHSAFVRQFPAVLDAWTMALRSQDQSVSYGFTRGLGALGEGFASMIVGYLIARMGFGAMFIAHAAFLLMAAAGASRLPDSHRKATHKIAIAPKEAAKALLHNPQYVSFALSVLCISVGVKIVGTFSPVLIVNLGGDSASYGNVMLLCGMLEFPVFMITSRLAKIVPLRYLYLVAIATMGLGGLLAVSAGIIPVSAGIIPVFLVGRCFISITYAIYITIIVEYVNKLISSSLRTTGMAVVAALMSGAAHIISSLWGGYLLDHFGQTAMLVTYVVIIGATLATFMPNLTGIFEKED